MSDITRLNIVELLSQRERCPSELLRSLELTNSELSFHLKVLKDAGVIRGQRSGRWLYYRLDGDALDRIIAFTEAVKPGRHVGTCALASCQ